MEILAIDPGTTETGWVLYDTDNRHIRGSGVLQNDEANELIDGLGHDLLAIEMIASYGMPVGREVFETCVWIGRFVERNAYNSRPHRLVYRKDVKSHLCGSPKAKDAHIRQALIDKLGAPGTKKAPGGTYGIKSHAWAALAVAVTAAETSEP